jgi:hypothetical protein
MSQADGVKGRVDGESRAHPPERASSWGLPRIPRHGWCEPRNRSWPTQRQSASSPTVTAIQGDAYQVGQCRLQRDWPLVADEQADEQEADRKDDGLLWFKLA